MTGTNHTTVLEKIPLYVVGSDGSVRDLVRNAKRFCLVNEPTEAEGVILTGGEDITPFLYGERPTHARGMNLDRDLREVSFIKTLKMDMPKIGICRGAQLLNVLSGGRLLQHVDGHAIHGRHDMRLEDTGEIVWTNSLHHQEMVPPSDAVIIAKANVAPVKFDKTTKITYNRSTRKDTWDDIEIVYIPSSNSYCFQGHPEYCKPDDPQVDLFWEHVEKYCYQ